MKNVLFLLLCALVVVGCGSDGAADAKESKPMRDAMSGKSFDPDKAPPEAKAMMEQMSKQGPSTPAPK